MMKTAKTFYENLGKLFYSVAMADSRVHRNEIVKLRAFIRQFWLDVDELEDEFGTDATFQIESVFDWLMANDKDGNECFEEFREFYKENATIFTPFIKVLIMDTANAIANSFSEKNKAELVVLGKLELLLKQ
ncbi:hypothetical protein DHD32_17650 [Arenibacter sp. TNZ]|jgi:hypothetical protein|uniref:hypothetical protein n=1 Tax=Arenibacter TaxID=178469 RepID=UPI000CD3FD76|nr:MULTISPECIES: hypothetical protein [Arenibacter]MCM4173303.1 hypothetical protein [Arenibacter sp. TNZ]